MSPSLPPTACAHVAVGMSVAAVERAPPASDIGGQAGNDGGGRRPTCHKEACVVEVVVVAEGAFLSLSLSLFLHTLMKDCCKLEVPDGEGWDSGVSLIATSAFSQPIFNFPLEWRRIRNEFRALHVFNSGSNVGETEKTQFFPIQFSLESLFSKQ